MIFETLVFVGEIWLVVYVMYRVGQRQWNYFNALSWITLGMGLGIIISIGVLQLNNGTEGVTETLSGPAFIVAALGMTLTGLLPAKNRFNQKAQK